MPERFSAVDAGSLMEEVVGNWRLFKRNFPWRGTSDLWHVLVAEVLLLQTDAAKVSMVYPRFIELFPEPCSLLKADRQVLEDLLKPLGLYRQRADRLIKLAAYIRDKYSCIIPCSYEKLKAIPGIGDYIAAAVCILACGCSAQYSTLTLPEYFHVQYLERTHQGGTCMMPYFGGSHQWLSGVGKRYWRLWTSRRKFAPPGILSAENAQ